MSAALSHLEHEVAARVREDTEFARVLSALVTAPSTPHGTLERVAARNINDLRRDSLVQDFIDGSMPTPDVQKLLKLRTPQAVHRLRSRGKLLGATFGNQTYFPAWQFDGERIRPDLARILELLARFTSDAFAADRIVRIKRDDLGDRSIAEALRSPKTSESAWLLLTSIGA